MVCVDFALWELGIQNCSKVLAFVPLRCFVVCTKKKRSAVMMIHDNPVGA